MMTHPITHWLQPLRVYFHQTLNHFPAPLAEFILFGLKMAWSCLFGAAMLILLIVTHLFWPNDALIYRYDFLFVAALFIQFLMVWTRLESIEELKVIGLYHIIGTLMEVFKTHMGSWVYPEASLIHIAGVPLFTGFMYGTVGSFIARVIKVCDMRFEPYPRAWHTYVLAVLIYINFFTHHFFWDMRVLLFIAIAVVFWRTKVYFRVMKVHRHMPFLLAGTLTTSFLWLAENIGTLTKTWIYPNQSTQWHMVPIQKFGAWGLLLVISFVCVSLVIRFEPSKNEYSQ